MGLRISRTAASVVMRWYVGVDEVQDEETEDPQVMYQASAATNCYLCNAQVYPQAAPNTP